MPIMADCSMFNYSRIWLLFSLLDASWNVRFMAGFDLPLFSLEAFAAVLANGTSVSEFFAFLFFMDRADELGSYAALGLS